MNDYMLKEEIGKGNMSVVYKGRKKKTINFYAIYSIEKCKRQRVHNNVSILRNMNHDKVIRFHNWYETANHLWVITDLCVGGDLRTVLTNGGPMKENSLRLLGSDIATGLLYIHHQGYIYRDLKPANLLMDSTAMLRFYDFGLSCVFGAAGDQRLVGTPLYMAPELFIAKGGGPVPGVPSTASDLWALGCILYEMGAGKPAFGGDNLERVLRNILTYDPPPLPNMCDAFNELVRKLLVKDPLERASWRDVLSSRFWDGALDELRGKDGTPTEPDFAAYRRAVENARGRPARGSSPWTEAEVATAVAGMVAVAKANLAGSPAFNEDEENYGEVRVDMEVDFSASLSSSSVVAHPSDTTNNTTPASGRATHAAASTTTTAAGTARRESVPPGDAVHNRTRLAGGSGSGGSERGPAVRQQNNAMVSASGASTTRHGSGSRPTTYLTPGERVTRRQLEEFGGAVLARTVPSELVWHNADNNIRPLCPNSRIEKYVEPSYDPAGFGFTPRRRAELKDMSEEELDEYVRRINAVLGPGAKVSMETKENMLRYIETVVSEARITTLIVNSMIFVRLIDDMRDAALPLSYRITSASVAGMIIRYAVSISYHIAEFKVGPHLLALFESETNTVLRRKVFVCCTEVIFYVCSLKTEKERAQWNISPSATVRTFTAALESRDDVLQHYAAKMAENLSTSLSKSEFLCIPRVIEALLAIYSSPSNGTHSEHMRSSALCAALRLASLKEQLIPVVLRSSSLPRDTYVEIVTGSPTARSAQVLLGFLIVALIKAMAATGNPFVEAWASRDGNGEGVLSPEGRAMLASTLKADSATLIVQEIVDISEAVTDKLCEANERTPVSLRGKSLLLYVAVGCLGGTALCRLCTSRAVLFWDRLVREDDDYVRRCGDALGAYLSIYTAEKLNSVARGVSAATTPALLSSLQQILNAGTLRRHIRLQPETFRALAKCVEQAMRGSGPHSRYEEDYFSIADRITQAPDAVVEYHEHICASLVAPFASMLQGKESHRCFAALTFLTSVFLPISTDLRIPRDAHGSVTGAVARATEATLVAASRALPELLAETNPIPAYTLRLMAMCGDCSREALGRVATSELLSSVMTYLSSSSTDGDLFYPLRLLYIGAMRSTERGAVEFLVEKGLSPLLLRALRSAMEAETDNVLEVSCKIAAFVTGRDDGGASNSCSVKCSDELMEDDSLCSIFLPLAACDTASGGVNKKAAHVIYHLARNSSTAQAVLLSSRGTGAVCKVLTRQPLNGDAAEWVMKALRQAAEVASPTEMRRKIGGDRHLRAALDGVSGSGVPRAVSSEATRLARFIAE